MEVDDDDNLQGDDLGHMDQEVDEHMDVDDEELANLLLGGAEPTEVSAKHLFVCSYLSIYLYI